jgi:hypothetical protein
MSEFNSVENQFFSWGFPTIIFVVANSSMSAFRCPIPNFPHRLSIQQISGTTANESSGSDVK